MWADGAPNVLSAALEQAELTLADLWLRYIGLGGTASMFDVHAHIGGMSVLDTLQHDTLVQALNERFLERNMDHPVPYVRAVSNDDAVE
jgi:hypothetical protein